jgi:hypothetical protein
MWVILNFKASLSDSLNFRVCQYLDFSTIIKIGQISKDWRKVAIKEDIWKYKCFSRGWGIVFIVPTSVKWSDLYKSMIKVEKSELITISKFQIVISKETGDLYKRFNSFLLELPEYVQLERSIGSKAKTLSDIVNFESANDIFLAVEKEIDLVLMDDLLRSGNSEETSRMIIERKAGQRNKLYTFKGESGKPSSSNKQSCDSGSSSFAFTKILHSVITRAAHKSGGMLPPVVEKFRKIAGQHGVTTPVIKLDFASLLLTKNQRPIKKITSDQKVSSIYIKLAKFVHICYAYHRGVEVLLGLNTL